MMHADLIDQDDLRDRLQTLGFPAPPGATPEQACEHAVIGLDAPRALALRKLVEQMLSSGAVMLPAVREAIAKQLLPALAQYKETHGG